MGVPRQVLNEYRARTEGVLGPALVAPGCRARALPPFARRSTVIESIPRVFGAMRPPPWRMSSTLDATREVRPSIAATPRWLGGRR